jgi:hypothetical protein
MEGSAIAPPHQVGQKRFMIAAMLLGAAGSMIAIAAFGEGRYSVGPMVIEMQAKPATSGTTELGVNPVPGLQSGIAKADTHAGFLAFRGTVVGVIGGESNISSTLALLKDPESLATTIRDQGKDAFRRFGIRLGWLTLAGGGAGGLAISLIGMKTRRVLQGALGGVILVGALGLVAWQTYDIDKFSQVQFRQAGQAVSVPAG